MAGWGARQPARKQTPVSERCYSPTVAMTEIGAFVRQRGRLARIRNAVGAVDDDHFQLPDHIVRAFAAMASLATINGHRKNSSGARGHGCMRTLHLGAMRRTRFGARPTHVMEFRPIGMTNGPDQLAHPSHDRTELMAVVAKLRCESS